MEVGRGRGADGSWGKMEEECYVSGFLLLGCQGRFGKKTTTHFCEENGTESDLDSIYHC